MPTVHFGAGLYLSKYIAAMSSTSGQGYKVSPSGALTYSAATVAGLVSARNGYAEDYRYGVEIQPEPIGRLGTYNANGIGIHPIITFATDKPSPIFERYLAGGPAGSTTLHIFSGTKPTTTNDMTSLVPYLDNLLLSFPIPAGINGIKCLTHDLYNSANITINNTFKNPGIVQFILGICTTRTAATGSGTATWFWFGNSSNPTDLSDISFVIGDVGSSDDGKSDLYMANPNIEAGKQYLSGGFKFTFPSIITV